MTCLVYGLLKFQSRRSKQYRRGYLPLGSSGSYGGFAAVPPQVGACLLASYRGCCIVSNDWHACTALRVFKIQRRRRHHHHRQQQRRSKPHTNCFHQNKTPTTHKQDTDSRVGSTRYVRSLYCTWVIISENITKYQFY